MVLEAGKKLLKMMLVSIGEMRYRFMAWFIRNSEVDRRSIGEYYRFRDSDVLGFGWWDRKYQYVVQGHRITERLWHISPGSSLLLLTFPKR